MSDSSIVIIQGTVGLYTVATRCHRCFAVTLKYTEDSSLKILPHSLGDPQNDIWHSMLKDLLTIYLFPGPKKLQVLSVVKKIKTLNLDK